MVLTKDCVERGEAAGGFVADDRERVGYRAFAARVGEIGDALSGQPWASPGQVVALTLGNTVSGIATLLALLDRSVSVALLPGNDAGEAPGFCSARLDPGALTASEPNVAGIVDVGLEPRLYIGTSGSTGAAKWVIIGVEALHAVSAAMIRRMRLTPEDRVLIPVPVCHSFGVTTALLPSLRAGASVRLTARGDPLSILQAEQSADPTFAFMIPSQCRALLPLRRKPRSYRGVVVATGRLTPEFAARFEKVNGPVVALYGSTELSAAAAADPAAPAERRHRDIGPPLDGIGIVIEVDAADRTADGAGEILVRHHGRFLGMPMRGAVLVRPQRRFTGPEIWAGSMRPASCRYSAVWTTG